MGRANSVLRAVLPPIVLTATRPARRRLGLLRGSSLDLRLTDGVIELRPLNKGDRRTIERAARDPEIGQRFGVLKRSPGDYFAHFWDGSRAGDAVAFAVCDVGGECLGLVTVERRDAGATELGYWLLPEGRGGGRATRALCLASRWAIGQPGIARLWLSTAPDNIASQQVAERSGYRREGVLRSHHEVNGHREDAVMFSLLPGDLDDRAGDDPAAKAPASDRTASGSEPQDLPAPAGVTYT